MASRASERMTDGQVFDGERDMDEPRGRWDRWMSLLVEPGADATGPARGALLPHCRAADRRGGSRGGGGALPAGNAMLATVADDSPVVQSTISAGGA